MYRIIGEYIIINRIARGMLACACPNVGYGKLSLRNSACRIVFYADNLIAYLDFDRGGVNVNFYRMNFTVSLSKVTENRGVNRRGILGCILRRIGILRA